MTARQTTAAAAAVLATAAAGLATVWWLAVRLLTALMGLFLTVYATA